MSFTVRAAQDGGRVIAASQPLGPYRERLCDAVRDWAQADPERVFLAERDGAVWRELTYGETWRRMRDIAAGLLHSGASAEAPLGALAENGIALALVTLAALYAGIPFSPLSVGYAAPEASVARLRDLLGALAPGALFAGSARIAERLADAGAQVPVFADVASFRGDPALADDAFSRVTGDTVAKIMFTSGSTGTPKGVVTTNRMLCSNAAMAAFCFPETRLEPPVIVDWLPWSHCFGGSHNFDIVLDNGGTLYVDEGRPAPGAFTATVRNVREIAPTMHFSVPRGFALLAGAIHEDSDFARRFFSRVRVLCNAGASIPQSLREELTRLARAYAPHAVRISSSWGTTETAPLATASWGAVEPETHTIGTPVPGVELKLAPSDGRDELRVRGPNVTPGYWRNPAATADAFDAEGFYKTGDAGRLADESDPSRGIVFEGRLAENFKLSTGTWVNVGQLRLALLEHGAPVVEDVVITGHDRDALGALIFVTVAHAASVARRADAAHRELADDAGVRAFVAAALARHNRAAPASSTRIARALILPEPPNRAEGEITEKGSVNQRRALALRAADVAALYDDAALGRAIEPAAEGAPAAPRR